MSYSWSSGVQDLYSTITPYRYHLSLAESDKTRSVGKRDLTPIKTFPVIITLFKNHNHKSFVRAFDSAVKSTRGGTIDWRPNPNAQARENGAFVGWATTTDSVSSIFVDAPCSDVTAGITKILKAPTIDVFFQENMFWEFSLEHEGSLRVNFSVAREEWGEINPEWEVGSAADLAELWSVPIQQVEKYMVNWQPTEIWSPEMEMMTRSYRLHGQKAYPSDEYGYGEMYQGLDFIRALGGDNPQNGQKFWVYLPPPKPKPPQ